VQWFEGVRELVQAGVVPARARDNAEAYKGMISGILDEVDATLFFDPQTSGGLLASIPEANVQRFFDALGDWPLGARIVGRVTARAEFDAIVR
jgi:selenide, water dikinase